MISRPVSAMSGMQPVGHGEHAVADAPGVERFRAVLAQLLVGACRARFQQLARTGFIHQIGHAHADACHLVFVGGTDTAPRSADLELAAFPLTGLIELLVIVEQQMCAATHAQPSIRLDTAFMQAIELLEELLEVEHHAVAQQTARTRVQNAGWNLVQDEGITAHVHGVACVGATLVARDDGRFRGQHIDDLALAFIAPLGADHDQTT